MRYQVRVLKSLHFIFFQQIGDEVWLAVPYWASGTLAQYVVAKERQVARKPRGIGFEGAAALPYSGSIAWDAMVNQAKLNSHNTRGKRLVPS